MSYGKTVHPSVANYMMMGNEIIDETENPEDVACQKNTEMAGASSTHEINGACNPLLLDLMGRQGNMIQVVNLDLCFPKKKEPLIYALIICMVCMTLNCMKGS